MGVREKSSQKDQLLGLANIYEPNSEDNGALGMDQSRNKIEVFA
jgi:hypothetical protein